MTEKICSSLSSYQWLLHLTITLIKLTPHIFELVHAISRTDTTGKKKYFP